MPTASSPSRRPARVAAVTVFLTALPLLWLRFGHWFYLSLDEGISLEGARRVAAGQAVYRDFFNLTGPGTFWLYGLVFRMFGVSFAAARAVLCVELAAICALVCLLVSRVSGVVMAAGSAVLFLVVLLTTPYPVYVTHRWDSNLFALAAVTCAAGGWFFLAGALAAMAAWTTPPLLWVTLAVGLWCRRAGYLFGICTVSASAVAVLTWQGALGRMLQSLWWDAANYAGANRLAYGALSGGSHFAAAILPAILPPLAAVLVAIALGFSRDSGLVLLAAAATGAFVACLPRLGTAQLLFASAFFWAACWYAVGCVLSRRARMCLGVTAMCLAAGLGGAWWPRQTKGKTLRKIETPVGNLSVSPLHFMTLNDLQAALRPGERVFVYPYLPALYFALGVENPSRYSWLQPGMMGRREEQAAIADLVVRPPRWVVWHDFTEAYILKNWPASDRSRLHFPDMEAFLLANYHVVNPDGVVPSGFRLLEKNP